jgi:hypothetical protein
MSTFWDITPCSSETLVNVQRATRRYIPKDRALIFSTHFDSRPCKIFLFTASRPVLSRTHLLSNGYRGVKRQGLEADHSPPSSAEIKKDGAIPLLPYMSSWHSA